MRGSKHSDIVIFVEHVARELDIACGVKLLAENRYSLKVRILPIAKHLTRTLGGPQPSVIVIPYCYSANDFGVGDILSKWKDAVYVNLVFEQVLQKINQSIKVPLDDFARRCVLHHAWSDSYADVLHAHGVPAEQIFINGNPSYMLFKDPYRSYFDSKSQLAHRFELDPRKRWVFIPENYGAAFYDDNRIAYYIRHGNNDADAYRDFALQSLHKCIAWWSQAATQVDIEVIVRPRPATPLATFMEVCVDVVGQMPQHIHVIKDGTVREWVLASEIVLSSYSTTLIEASIAEKTIYMLEPIPFPPFLHADWYGLVTSVRSFDEFMNAVTNDTLENNFLFLKDWAERNMLSNGDAISNLVDFLAEVYQGKWQIVDASKIPNILLQTKHNSPKSSASLRVAALAHKIMENIRILVGKKRFDPHEQDNFSDKDVAMRVRKWAKVLDDV